MQDDFRCVCVCFLHVQKNWTSARINSYNYGLKITKETALSEIEVDGGKLLFLTELHTG